MTRLILAIPLVLAACAPTMQDFASECAGYGFTREDPRFPECVMLVQQQYEQRQQAAYMALGAMGQAMQAREAAAQPARPVTCNTIGNQTQCW